MPQPMIRTRRAGHVALNGQGPGEPCTSDLVLGIVATAMLAAFCLLMASNLVSGALEAVG
ncbi:hypothetical protein [Methylobacterium radiotolerans]|uniref:hypothetical protein n=1 Tax=Methylobacterium radiotolerans TaxID=31998 RepID=UPI001F4102DE|nr:hypothetical protein [Methylobacterium radiotolerans]UIY44220.1 hypothetical protein LZ599_11235 [Methylobacterium radiotolerans]